MSKELNFEILKLRAISLGYKLLRELAPDKVISRSDEVVKIESRFEYTLQCTLQCTSEDPPLKFNALADVSHHLDILNEGLEVTSMDLCEKVINELWSDEE